jgi:hypothetical protein
LSGEATSANEGSESVTINQQLGSCTGLNPHDSLPTCVQVPLTQDVSYVLPVACVHTVHLYMMLRACSTVERIIRTVLAYWSVLARPHTYYCTTVLARSFQEGLQSPSSQSAINHPVRSRQVDLRWHLLQRLLRHCI